MPFCLKTTPSLLTYPAGIVQGTCACTVPGTASTRKYPRTHSPLVQYLYIPRGSGCEGGGPPPESPVPVNCGVNVVSVMFPFSAAVILGEGHLLGHAAMAIGGSSETGPLDHGYPSDSF